MLNIHIILDGGMKTKSYFPNPLLYKTCAWEMCWCVYVYSINSSGHHVPAVTQHFRFRLKFDCFNHLNYRSTFNSSDSSNCCVCYDQQSKGYYNTQEFNYHSFIDNLKIEERILALACIITTCKCLQKWWTI